ncbi:MAG: hypothetical protein ACRCTP_09355 [Aeromonas popoffii]|uniref:hypothetical protein n=1 Tax=Aeromonas popoffii TaxID=70856 RepID=UPI003F37F2B7
MTHEDKVYEYARRISHYSLEASDERKMSKIFDCSRVDANKSECGERCGCSRRVSLIRKGLMNAGDFAGAESVNPSFCESCDEAKMHYHAFRDAVSKKATALRQLNNEMLKHEVEVKKCK